MLILCSNGLSSSALKSSLSSTIKSGKSALVVTADNEYKENNYHVARCISELNSLHLDVDIIDIDKQPIQDLLIYDVVEFIGGNPYYLLNSLKKQNAKKVLQKIASEKVLIGWSAGALVMTPTIGIINVFSPEMNQWGITDFSAMNLTDIEVIPHYNKFLKRYDCFEEQCQKYEKVKGIRLIRLNDGEGISITQGKEILIR